MTPKELREAHELQIWLERTEGILKELWERVDFNGAGDMYVFASVSLHDDGSGALLIDGAAIDVVLLRAALSTTRDKIAERLQVLGVTP